MCQIDTIPPTSAEASIRKQIAERNNVSESYVVRSEKFMRGVQIMDQMITGMQEKILSGQFKVRDADIHRLAKAAYVKVETTKILKQHKAYMAQFEEMLNEKEIA